MWKEYFVESFYRETYKNRECRHPLIMVKARTTAEAERKARKHWNNNVSRLECWTRTPA